MAGQKSKGKSKKDRTKKNYWTDSVGEGVAVRLCSRNGDSWIENRRNVVWFDWQCSCLMNSGSWKPRWSLRGKANSKGQSFQTDDCWKSTVELNLSQFVKAESCWQWCELKCRGDESAADRQTRCSRSGRQKMTVMWLEMPWRQVSSW